MSFQNCVRNIHLKLSDFVDFVYERLDKGEIQFNEFDAEQQSVNEMFADYLVNTPTKGDEDEIKILHR